MQFKLPYVYVHINYSQISLWTASQRWQKKIDAFFIFDNFFDKEDKDDLMQKYNKTFIMIK